MSQVLSRSGQPASVQTFDAEEGTVEVLWVSKTRVQRQDLEGPYLEELSIAPNAVRTARLENGSMSLLDSHSNASMSDRLGTVVPGSLRFEHDAAYATVKLSKNGRGAELLADLADGHPFAVSVGYRIHKTEEIEREDGAPVRLATDWEPLELSVVPIPADPNARTRSLSMTPPKTQHKTNVERRTQIEAIASRHNLPEDMALRAIDEGTSIDAFRIAVLDYLATEEDKTPTFGINQMSTSLDDGRQAVEDAIYARMSGKAPPESVRHLMDQSLADLARVRLEAMNVSTRQMTRTEVLTRSFAAHTTSDFPLLLQSAGNRILHESFELAQSPVRRLLTRSTLLSDFRSKQGIRLSDMGLLEKVNEAGEVSHTTRAEVGAESYRLDTFARIFSMSRQALINDDLDAFTDFSRTAGRMAAETENRLVYNLLKSNPVMEETGKTLFHADHNNMAASPTPLSENALSEARLAMRTQRALDNGEKDRPFLNVQPRYLVVGPALETAAEKQLAAIYAATTDNVNPFTSRLELLVEPRIEDESWFVFADPVLFPVLEHAYLSGAPGPQMASENGFEVMGIRFRVSLDFGAGVIDFRGGYAARSS
jgi:HK97 family phage prohead protease